MGGASPNRGSVPPLRLFTKHFVDLIELKNVAVLLGVLLMSLTEWQRRRQRRRCRRRLLLSGDGSSRQEERRPNRCYWSTEHAM